MASDLVLRLCQVDEDDGGFPSDRHIAIADFIGGLYDILGGYHTVTQMKQFYDMTPTEQAQFDVLVAKLDAPQLAQSIGRIQRFRSILNKWERKDVLNVPIYDTPDDIELMLSEIDQGF